MKSQTLKPDDLIINSLTAFFRDVGNLNLDSRRNSNLDLQTILHRFKEEGLGFVTKTLPKFGKHFDKCLQNEKFSTFSAFKRNKKGVLPSFLKGLLEKVFVRETGVIDSSPNVEAIKAIRQISYMFYKLEGDYPEKLVDEVLENFKTVDDSLSHCDEILPEKAGIINIANDFLRSVFNNFDHLDIIPRPGPGQTADRVPHWERYEPHTHYNSVHQVYPYYKYFYCSPDHLQDRVAEYKSMPRHEYGVSVVTTVPKDSRGPRIICMVPHEYMWLQQGLGRAMMSHLEKHYLTRGHVNFTDQNVNGNLALTSSKLLNYVTLDMKEASDRISTSLVDALFDGIPLKNALLALSTPKYILPSGEVIHAKKFAPMGSALCFPVMSIVHYALSIAALVQQGWSLHRARKSVYVYGDDLVVAADSYMPLLEEFPIYGLQFNIDKCCCTGKFRESCGTDAYDGVNVTPTRIKKSSYAKKSGADFKSLVDIANNLMEKGYSYTALWFRNFARSIYGNIPYVSNCSGMVGFITNKEKILDLNKLNRSAKIRYNSDLQCEEICGRVVKTVPYASHYGHWEQLVRGLNHTIENSSDFSARDHVKMKWSWVPMSSA